MASLMASLLASLLASLMASLMAAGKFAISVCELFCLVA